MDAVEYDVLIEATPTNIVDAEPAKSLTLKAFADGKDVVTSNKGHLALFYKELINTAKENGVENYEMGNYYYNGYGKWILIIMKLTIN